MELESKTNLVIILCSSQSFGSDLYTLLDSVTLGVDINLELSNVDRSSIVTKEIVSDSLIIHVLGDEPLKELYVFTYCIVRDRRHEDVKPLPLFCSSFSVLRVHGGLSVPYGVFRNRPSDAGGRTSQDTYGGSPAVDVVILNKVTSFFHRP